jgi:hypothetical protein
MGVDMRDEGQLILGVEKEGVSKVTVDFGDEKSWHVCISDESIWLEIQQLETIAVPLVFEFGDLKLQTTGTLYPRDRRLSIGFPKSAKGESYPFDDPYHRRTRVSMKIVEITRRIEERRFLYIDLIARG